MGRVLVIGEPSRIRSFAMSGALVAQADDDRAVLQAWASRGDDVALVILTPRAAAALSGQPWPSGVLRAVMDG